MRKLVNIFYDVRKEEWMTTALMFVLHFLLMATLYFLKPARDSLFLSEIGPRQLPWVYLLLAAVSVPVSILMSKYLRQHTSRKVLQGSLGFFIVSLLALRWVFSLQVQWIYLLFYLWVGIFGILVISQFWLYANALFNAAQSKRLFSFLNLGAILGAIAGSQASTILVAWLELSTRNLLYVSMGVLALSAALIFLIPDAEEDEEEELEEDDSSFAYSTRDVFNTVWGSRYQLLLAGIIGFAMLVSTLVDYQFKTVATEAYPSTSSLTSFMGSFYGGISLASLGIQVLLSTQIIKRLGLGGAVLTRPVSILVGAVLFLFEPVLAVAVYMQGFDRATRYSIDKTGRELLFLPLPQRVKRKTKIFMDIFVNRFFRGIAGLLLVGFIYWREFTVGEISYVVIGAIAVWVGLGFWARKAYVEKFRDSLRKRYIDVDQITLNLDESVVYRAVREMLESGNNSRILYALIMLKDSKVDKVGELLRELLDNDHDRIRLRALKLLQRVETVDATEQVKGLLDDPEPEVRLEAVNYLCARGEDDPQTIMRSYLQHEDENLKYAALSCLHKHGDADVDIDDEVIENVLEREDKDGIVMQAQIAQVLGFLPDHPKRVQYLSTLLSRPHPVVVKKALESIRQLGDKEFIDNLMKKLRDPEHVSEVQRTLASFGEECFDTYREIFFDETTDLEIQKRIPEIYTKMASQRSVQYLLDMLQAENPTLRYQVVKALNKMKKKRASLTFDAEAIRAAIRAESQAYFRLLAIKMQQRTDIPNNILIISLKEKMDQTKERLFRLTGLLYDQQDIYGSYLALQSSNEDARAASVEFIDSVLRVEDKDYIVPIIDIDDDEEKLEEGQALFDIGISSYEEAMLALLDGDDIWLRACAIFSVSAGCPPSLQQHVQQATANEMPGLVRETAEYVLERNNNP